MTKKAFIYITITIIWITIIFSFSLQPGEVSSKTSTEIGKSLIEASMPHLAGKAEAVPIEQLGALNFFLRKGTHFLEYFVLGMLMRLSLLQTRMRYKAIMALVGCVLIASADETIQLFVIGRTGKPTDVLLDGVGALCGICIMIFVRKCPVIIKSRREDEKHRND